MTTSLCMTVDVEDFYEGMAVLGHDVPRRDLGPGVASGLCSSDWARWTHAPR